MGENRKKNPLYGIYFNIKGRCYNKNCKEYHYYGGRGVGMSDEWFKDFNVFCQDMGERPSKEYSIDRIDVNGNYEKSNCCWSTSHQQHANKRNSNEIVGVFWDESRGKWSAHLVVNSKKVLSKRFKNYDDAVLARKLAEKENGIIYYEK